MKKILFLGAMAAMLLGTASCSNDMEPEMTDGTVQFKVELPGNIDSRANISDGTTATKLEVACYDADGNYIPTLVAPTTITITPFNERVATVTMKLVKGQTYSFAFFAHADGAPYAFNAGTKLSECNFTVTDNYTGTACVSNAENRDAFYATLTDYEVTSATTEVELHRPFAQLNFGTDDLAAAEAAGIIPGQSMVTVKQVATSFNLSTGKAATDDAVDATFALAARPTEKLVVDKEYDWMAMNYFLVPNNEANVDVEMTVKTADKNGTAREDVVVPVNSVPVKKNHRTNILGSLFTQEGNFKVIIEPAFDTPDYNVEPINPIEVRTNEELLAALYTTDKKNISIKLMNDISNFEIGARTAWGNDVLESLTIDGNGHRLGFWLKDSDWNSFGTKNDADLIIKNITLGVDHTQGGTWNTWAMNIINYSGLVGKDGQESTVSKVTMTNVTCERTISVTQDATFENVTFKETTEHYTLFIKANVKNVTFKNCSFIASNGGRGVKVADQYVDKNNRQKVNITVSGTTFNTAKKAAILLSNTAGANINWQSGNDISMVAEEQINAVWVDKKNCANSGEESDFYSNYQDQVTCTGCTFIVEP